MSQRGDQVFQLSLTEIAFTVAFILLLLLGYLVFKEQAARTEAERALAQVQQDGRAADALNAAKVSLTGVLRGAGKSNPDDIISQLIAADKARAERDELKRKVEDLDSKLTALTKLEALLESAPTLSKKDLAIEEVSSALALQDEVRKALIQSQAPASGPEPGKRSTSSPSQKPGERREDANHRMGSTAKEGSQSDASPFQTKEAKAESDRRAVELVREAIATTAALKRELKVQLDSELSAGAEAKTVQELVHGAKGYGDLTRAGASPDVVRKENSDLRGQVAFLRNKLEARGGRDYPPCWADEDGKVEFLISLELRPDGVVAAPAWPPTRETDAKTLPGLTEMLAGLIANKDFSAKAEPILDWSKHHDPQCRHYVYIKSTISDAILSDRARLMVENYFYKVEARR